MTDFNKTKTVNKAIIHSVPSLYILNYRKIRGVPITFASNKHPVKHRPWQIDILNDQHPDKVVRKSRQLGLSEMAVSECIWFLDNHPLTNAMYTFPRKEQMEDFSNTRIKPIFEESQYLSGRLDPKMDNVRLKKLINGSALFLRSAWGSALGEGQAVDWLGLDEYDRMKDGVELAFTESMKSSRYGYLRRWSTPTIPGRGVDLLFDKSDQRWYHHKCDRCGHWQVLTLDDNIIQVKPNGVNIVDETIEDGTYKFICSHCKQELNRWYKGEYVARYPSRKDRRGYHISQLDAVWISADAVMRNQFTYKVKQLFYNYVIGLPYASEGLLITDQDVLGLIGFEQPVTYRDPKYVKIVAGIDWGYTNWMAIFGLREDEGIDLLDVYWMADDPKKPLDSVIKLGAALQPYDPDIIIADNGFGADRNSYLLQVFPGRLWACDWDSNKTNVPMLDQWNDNASRVRADKTVKMKRVLYSVKMRKIRTFGQSEKLSMLTKHLKNVRLMMEEDDGEIYEKVTRIGDDHLSCCLAYGLMGIDRILEKHKPSTDMEYDYM